MSGKLRPPEHLVHGLAEPVVVVPARFAVWLNRTVGLDALRQQAVGDPHVGSVLTALALLVANESTSVGRGTRNRNAPEAHRQLSVMTTSQAANLLGCTDRSIRLAIDEGRLLATKNAAGHWRIARTDLEQYAAARAA